ncbi:undecaprenyl-diphosphate phosphatase [Fodinicola feengrottensis]|uniref:undecaprenyl-diphosphate phosphatase n=1 Tax=Fodinicola feengrottensis TaxID=435914 RepID=UPI002441F257|nr:undecaprenyl-diphosphate phosphatase [Fodinicola feengrottensis]
MMILADAVTGDPANQLNYIQAVILGIVEGVTEFLPVSSTGHLTVVEKIMGLTIDNKGVTAFTAIIQVGAILAAVLYFIKDIVRIVVGFVKGIFSADARQQLEWRFGWAIIVGSIPIAVVGLLAKDIVTGALRSLWFVAAGLILWSAVMVAAEWYHNRLTAEPLGRHGPDDSGVRHEDQVTIMDALLIGLAQCIALVPGVSRSGATISIGLFRHLDRVAATPPVVLPGHPGAQRGRPACWRPCKPARTSP